MVHITKKTAFLGIIALCLIGAIAISFAQTAFGASYPDPRENPQSIASSSVISLTWGAASSRILATTTGKGGRTATAIQAINCGTNGQVWLAFNDFAAGTSTGYSLTGSSTLVLGQDIPMVTGSIRALASSANCSVLVNEFRTLI